MMVICNCVLFVVILFWECVIFGCDFCCVFLVVIVQLTCFVEIVLKLLFVQMFYFIDVDRDLEYGEKYENPKTVAKMVLQNSEF